MIPFYDRTINIDSGNKCTLECAACVRQIFKKNNWTIPGDDLTLNQFDKLSDYFKKVSFCGTYSDPIFNPNFIEILKLCKKKNIQTEISTAASQRPERWYKEAFEANDKAVWVFGIDGLPKDSHKYRTHQKGEYLFDMMLWAHYEKIPVQWQYIVFDYNKDNIEEAKEIAKLHKINIMFIYSERNFKVDTKVKNSTKEDVKKELKKDLEILPIKSYTVSKNKKGTINPKCLHTKRDLSYSNTGHLMPCCWLNTRYKEPKIKELFDNKLHIDNNTVEDIINSNEWITFFNRLKNKPDTAPQTCRKFCKGALEDNPEETKVRYANNLL
tara:strand:+ start:1417 stop:2394 length:978 start_codon:yes stop_codon:yes gene_type:complete